MASLEIDKWIDEQYAHKRCPVCRGRMFDKYIFCQKHYDECVGAGLRVTYLSTYDWAIRARISFLLKSIR